MIIESEIGIEFFLKSNWIEIDFLAGIFSILIHGYIGKDNALQRAAAYSIRRPNYTNRMPRQPHGTAASTDVV